PIIYFLMQFIQIPHQRLAQIIPGQRDFYRCLDKTELLPDIIAIAINFESEHTLNFIQFLNGISQLDFPAGTDFLLSKKIEYLRCQDIPADNRHIRWCCALLWFFDKVFHLMQVAKFVKRIDNPITVRFFIRNCMRSEEHTSELQSRFDLVCRLLLEQ